MFARVVTFGAVAVMCLLSTQSVARGSPPPTGVANAPLNRLLATMAFARPPANTPHPSVEAVISARAPAVQPITSEWLSNPTVAAIAARFTSAERFLHYRHGGVDANFWGVLSRARSVRIGYTLRL